MDNELKYDIWYHKVFGKNIGAARVLKEYGSIRDFYEAVISGKEKAASAESRLKTAKEFSLVDADAVIGLCEENGWEIITRESEYFPPMLREISDCPRLLFAHGKKEVLTRSVAVALVGSRDIPEKAEIITRNSAYNLAKTGAVVVSGAALGADSAAHRGAVEAGGETVAVLGCGLGSDYTDRIGSLYDDILAHGVFVTEMFPYENASRYTFPERNRIISGISRAVLVTYAEKKSGSLITARLAKKQKRRVYALAPEINPCDGCNALIADNAYVFYHSGDIAYPLKDFFDEGLFNEGYCNRCVTYGTENVPDIKSEDKRTAEKKNNVKTPSAKQNADKKEEKKKICTDDEGGKDEIVPERELPGGLSKEARAIYLSLGDEPVFVNSFVKNLGISPDRLMASVFELCYTGLAQNLGGARIQKIKKQTNK